MSLSFCPDLETLYRTRQAIGRSGKIFNATNGLSTVNNLVILRRLLLEFRPERTMEIGMACGGSALTFAFTHRENGSSPRQQHVAIDGFQREGYDDVGRMMLERAGLSEYVQVREGLSSAILPKLIEEGRKFGLIYVDGSHRFEDVFCDFYYSRYLLEIGGYILFDDSSDTNVAKVLRFIETNLAEFFERVPIHTLRQLSPLQELKYRIGESFYKTQLRVFRKIKDGERGGNTVFRNF